MSRRPSNSNFYGQSKKFRASTSSAKATAIESGDKHNLDVSPVSNAPSDIEAALLYLKSKFPVEKFEGRLPPVLLVHQIYSIIKCKTSVDREINCLQAKGAVRVFKLGGEEAALVLISSDDLVNHITQHCPRKPVINRFVKELIPKVQDVSIDKELLQGDLGFTQQEISDLVSAGLLTLRSAASFWFSFPNAGEFMRTYLKGRKSVLRTIRKCKFSEILQFELEQRKLEKSAKLGMLYHIHDIIGAELVKWYVL